MPSHAHRPWISRAIAAGLVAASIGTILATASYLRLPGAMRLDWSHMIWVVLGYAVLCGSLGGLGTGAGMMLATQGVREAGTVSARRLVFGSVVGGSVGCLIPAVWGIVGFGSLHAPYAGTANLVFSILVACTAFVAFWAPALDGRPTGRWEPLRRLGLSAVASVVTVGSLGILGWTLAATLGAIPSFEWLAATADAYGLLPLALVAGVIVGVGVGTTMGLGTWIYLQLGRALTPRTP